MRTWKDGWSRLAASHLAAPLWIVLRIYLGLTWIRFGASKIEAGWLTANPLRPILQAVAGGGIPVPLESYRPIAGLILATGADRLLCVVVPLAEVAFGAAFLAGFLIVPAALGATLLNLNLLLSGIATWRFDGRIILLQLVLVAAWPGVKRFGAPELARRGCHWLRNRRPGRPARFFPRPHARGEA